MGLLDLSGVSSYLETRFRTYCPPPKMTKKLQAALTTEQQAMTVSALPLTQLKKNGWVEVARASVVGFEKNSGQYFGRSGIKSNTKLTLLQQLTV